MHGPIPKKLSTLGREPLPENIKEEAKDITLRSATCGALKCSRRPADVKTNTPSSLHLQRLYLHGSPLHALRKGLLPVVLLLLVELFNNGSGNRMENAQRRAEPRRTDSPRLKSAVLR